jgi:hypothetical protein
MMRNSYIVIATALCGIIGEPPETVLDGYGLQKFKNYYVVATEHEIGSNFKNLVPVYDAIEVSFNQFMAILQTEDKVQYLDNERILAETRVNDIDIQLSGSTSDVLRNSLFGERRRTLAYLNQVRGSLQIASKNLVSPIQKQAVWNEFQNQRAYFLKATKELRQLVNKAASEYAIVRADSEVRRALGDIKKTNSTVSLGPSKDLAIIIGRLNRAEEIVSFDPDANRRNYRKRKRK